MSGQQTGTTLQSLRTMILRLRNSLGSLATATVTGTPDGTKFLRDDFSWQAAGGGATVVRGTATATFGAFPGTTHTTVVITGQTGIEDTSAVTARFRAVPSADHTADEHVIAASLIDVICGNIVPGTGFTIHLLTRHTLPSIPQTIKPTQIANATANANQRLGADAPKAWTPDPNRMHGQFNLEWEWV